MSYTFASPEETNVATRIGGAKGKAAQQKAGDVTVEAKQLSTADGHKIEAEFGRLVVPENRLDPDANLIELKRDPRIIRRHQGQLAKLYVHVVICGVEGLAFSMCSPCRFILAWVRCVP